MSFFTQILNCARNAAGLAIKTSSSALAKVTNTTQITIGGVLIPVLGQDINLTNYTYIDTYGAVKTAALTIEDDMQCVLTVYASTAGAVTVGKGLEYTKSSHYETRFIDNSQIANKAVIGLIYIKNETGAQFVGNTTLLDASNLTVLYTDSYSSLGM